MKENLVPSSRPCDVEYRLHASLKSLDRAISWIQAIDPSAFSNSPHGLETCAILLESLNNIHGAMAETVNYLPQKSLTRPKKSVQSNEE